MLLEFVIKYWVEFAFGLIVTGGGYFIRRYLKMREDEQNRERTKFYDNFKKDIFIKYDEIKKESENGDLELQKQLDLLRKGILSLQKKEFLKNANLYLRKTMS